MIETVAREQSAVAPAALLHSLQSTQQHLLGSQHPQGYWVGELEADASVAAGYIPMMYFLTGSIPAARVGKILNYIGEKQRSDGSWSAYRGGPGDLNVTVQTYFAAKLAGVPLESSWLKAAREFIRRRGGLSGVNTITRIWLALFGQVGWTEVPTVPPEAILLPSWLPVNIYEFASWSRATIVALMAIIALRPFCTVPEYACLADIRVEGAAFGYDTCSRGRLPSWESFFLVLDRLLKLYERSPVQPLRRTALRRIERWILAHQEEDGGWGGILLPWVYSLIALKALGYAPDHPVIKKGIRGLDGFLVADGQRLWLQPATSPVWDTAWTVIALRESGLPADHPALQKAARWLLGQEIHRRGDWSVKNSKTKPGCWAFEFVNTLYPDLDDTAVVPRALLRVRLDREAELRKEEAIGRASAWIQEMQGRDGGWAAFDRDNRLRMLAHVPYADFMTPLDPASPDVTAHVVEFLAEHGARDGSLERGLRYLRDAQEADGAWFGRWGVNYTYGTALVLAALQSAGQRPERRFVRRAVQWLISRQNPDGGWGESCRTYDYPLDRGRGASTASQTSWALLGLVASLPGLGEAGETRVRESIDRGVRYLLSSQEPEGVWSEDEYTGTGFPGAFYLRYELYRLYFPLLALAKYYRTFLEGDEQQRQFARTASSERVLLLSHCLRKSASCKASYGSWGLECRHCRPDCAINQLSAAAERSGYGGACVAPGGSMAVKFVELLQPRAIVAVACRKELQEGIERVTDLDSCGSEPPLVMAIPLTKDGCVDTEVDVDKALRIITLGCPRASGRKEG